MSGTPLVSIVIPCFNHGHFLRDALGSIGTPAAPAEIVVIDDGSTDHTSEVLVSFDAPVPLRTIRQENAGLAAARNRGLAAGRGEFVIFLDADDRLAPGAVDIGVDALQAHPDCAFVFGRSQMMDRDGVLLPTPEQPRLVADHYRELLKRNYIWMPAMAAFRRQAVEAAGGFDSSVDAAADYEMYLSICRQHPVFDHTRLVAHYRKHDGNMSNDAGRMLRETLTVMRGQRRFVEGDRALVAAYREGWRNWQDYYGDHLAWEIRHDLRQKRLRDAVHKAVVMGWYHPRGLLQHARRKTGVTLAGGRRSPAKS